MSFLRVEGCSLSRTKAGRALWHKQEEPEFKATVDSRRDGTLKLCHGLVLGEVQETGHSSFRAGRLSALPLLAGQRHRSPTCHTRPVAM